MILTTEQVRASVPPHVLYPVEFDQWLAAHDAEVLRDAALSGDFDTTAQSALLARADRIAAQASVPEEDS